MRTEANPFLRKVEYTLNRLFRWMFGEYVLHVNPKYTEKSARLWMHWQNLCEDPKGNPRGFPWHGRAWLHWKSRTAHLEWVLGDFRFSLNLEVGDMEEALKFHIILPLIGLYFGIQIPFPTAWWTKKYRYDPREISLRIHDWAIWWTFWMNPNSYARRDPKWRRFVFHIDDFFLGRQKYSKQVLSTHDVKIPMPEGSYPATVILAEATWKRPRWFATRLRTAEVELKKPIPFPGKGENSWDCGEDGLHGLSTSAKNIEEAISKTVQSALRDRRRYGGNVMKKYPPPEVS
jgi:hypothetical protein